MYRIDFIFERTKNTSQAQQVIVRELTVENIIRQHMVLVNKDKHSEIINGESLRGYKFTYKMKKGAGLVVYKRYSVLGRYVATIELDEFSRFTGTFDELKGKLETIAKEGFEKLRNIDEAKLIFSQERI